MIARRVKRREKRICILFVKIVKREKWLEKWENHEVISALLNGLIIYNNWILCCTYWSLQQTYNIYIKTICFQMRVIKLRTLITYYLKRWSESSYIFFLHIWDVNIDSILQDDASHASFFQVTTFLRLRKHLFNKCRQVF